jgi:hypothetical protein
MVASSIKILFKVMMRGHVESMFHHWANEENHEPERKPEMTENMLQMLPKERGDLKETLDRTPKQRLLGGKPAKDGVPVGVRDADEAPEKANGGGLAGTLDRTLEPRLAPGKPGRPAGAGKYEWPPEMNKLLVEFAARYDVAKAKNVIADQLMELCRRDSTPRKDSFRNPVERRMVFQDYLLETPVKRRSLTWRSVLKRRRRKGPGPGFGTAARLWRSSCPPAFRYGEHRTLSHFVAPGSQPEEEGRPRKSRLRPSDITRRTRKEVFQNCNINEPCFS